MYDEAIEIIISQMEKHKISIKKLADIAYVNHNTMSKYLRKEKTIPADVLFALLQAIGYRLCCIVISCQNSTTIKK